MHNLVSFNQLFDWNQTEKELSEDKNQIINDYFECLTECNDSDKNCKRICRVLLSA